MSGSAMIPRLCCRNAAEAAEFYEKAFGAERLCVFQQPNGRVMHAELKVNGAVIYLVEEMPEHGAKSPLALAGTPVSLYLRVADCDAVFAQAVAAGCTVLMPLEDMFWGDRFGFVADPYGHRWEIATTIRQVGQEELQACVDHMGGGCPEAVAAVN